MKITFQFILAALLVSCASKSGGEKSLIQQASAEHKCPPSEISVLNKHESNGGASYQLNICGRQVTYYRVEGSYVEAKNYSGSAPAAQ
jgi:hypothetical protein